VEMVQIPSFVHDAIMEVRDSGMVNMLDIPGVINCLQEFGEDSAISWLFDKQNRRKYSMGIFEGFESVKETSSEDECVSQNFLG